ncbi:MAG: hypothetical protein HUJ25_12870 [Crocinitomicaceae bacterium]|nr:hypothetical protein [Crocinitomicaceae bacterium]
MAVKHTTLKYIRVLEELDFLQGYVSLIANSSSNEFNVELYLNDGLDPDTLLIPPMLIHHCVDLQIENRFSKHFSNGSLELHFYKIDDETVGCDIVDQNPEAHAFKEKHLKTGQKETLALLDEVRKDIFNNYEGEYNIEVDYIHSPNGEPMGTKTILSFPLLLDH